MTEAAQRMKLLKKFCSLVRTAVFFCLSYLVLLDCLLTVFIFAGMSFLRGVIDYIGSIFSETSSIHNSPQNRSREGASTMDSVNGVPVSNERYASKLKGYFNLSQEEIAKAVRAEEWGIVDDAILHYQNAHRILAEASSTAVPSFISSRYSEFCQFAGYLIPSSSFYKPTR